MPQKLPKPIIPDAAKRHSHQRIWQIIVPFICVFILILSAAAMSVIFMQRDGDIGSNLSSLSVIWLILPLIIMGMGTLVLVSFGIFLASKANGLIPFYTLKISTFIYQAAITIHRVSDTLANPIIKIEQRKENLIELLRRITPHQ